MKGTSKFGELYQINLGDMGYGYGIVLNRPLWGFYEYISSPPDIPALSLILDKPIAFKIFVMNSSRKVWTYLGKVPLGDSQKKIPPFFYQDVISNKLSIVDYDRNELVPASPEECQDLECEVVWEPERVVERIKDHITGRPNKWVEAMRPKT